MNATSRRARVRALAKINLDLRVLHKRPDGYHELRTVYQTISLADRLEIEYAPARRTSVALVCTPEIPGNLAERAARLVMEAMRLAGRVSMRLEKRIPMGAGLGGGSSDAAAVLLTLPLLAGRRLEAGILLRLAGELGSDVPLFLFGGTVLGVGRGSEVYPLPDLPRARGLLVIPPVHVSTATAYGRLGRQLTNEAAGNIINSFQSCIWRAGVGVSGAAGPLLETNDFESVVFREHPGLNTIKTKLKKAGAARAMMTGSGSAIYGLFDTREKLDAARARLAGERLCPFVFVSRSRYQQQWRRLGGRLVGEEIWR